MNTIHTDKAPAAVGPYSQAKVVGGLLFASGQIPLDPKTGSIVAGGIAFTLQAVGQRYTTASQAAIFLSSEAIFAALFGAMLLGERLPPTGLMGCALIFAAIIAVEALPPMLARRQLAKS